jgi:hypothetical protein
MVCVSCGLNIPRLHIYDIASLRTGVARHPTDVPLPH